MQQILWQNKTTVIKTESQRQGHNISQQNTRNLEKSVFVVPNSLLQMIKKKTKQTIMVCGCMICVFTQGKQNIGSTELLILDGRLNIMHSVLTHVFLFLGAGFVAQLLT